MPGSGPAAEPGAPAGHLIDVRAERRGRLGEIARVFVTLGLTAFGGPAAHIAMMEAELVRRRGWLSHAEFLDLVGATNLIPGPNSTELAIHLGYRRGGWGGLLVAGLCFIVPAALLVGGLAWAYQEHGTRPEALGALAGVRPVIVAVVGQALWTLGRSTLRSPGRVALAVAAFALALAGADELLVLAAAAVAAVVARGAGARPGRRSAAGVEPVTLAALFALFAKVGAVLFGSGYVLLAFLRTELVERRGWLTAGQLLDAVAAGQVTPGPVFTTATFAGYVVAGAPGAAVATAGIFLPAFVFVALSGPLVPRIRRSPTAGALLDGVNVASLALMAAVCVQLGRSALVSAPAVVVAVASVLLLVRYRMNAAWLMLAGAVVGLL